MYYKVIDKDCEEYKKLRIFRENEIRMDRQNRKDIKTIVGHSFQKFVGQPGQASFGRITRWSGFVFTNTTNIDARVWKTDKEFPNAYFPNRRYKEGKAMYNRINSLPKSSFFEFIELLKMDMTGNFCFPWMFLAGDVLLFYFDDKFEPNDPDFIEITKKEFEETRKKFPEKQ